MTFIYGINPVREALVAQKRKIEKIVLSRRSDEKIGGGKQEIAEKARKQGIALDYLTLNHVSSLAGTTEHQGVIAFLAEKEFLPLPLLIEKASSQGQNGILLILDGVEDPRNLGSIIRSAVAFGVAGIIVAKDRSVHITPAVAKVASGALEYVNLCLVVNISQTIAKLKEKGLWVWGLDAVGGKQVDAADLEGPLALVVGAEGRGIRHLVKKSCDGILRIPISKEISSLNAAVACSLAIYECRRQRVWTEG